MESWKAQMFKGVDVSKLLVQYYNQANAWMTWVILDTVSTKLNHQLSAKRQISGSVNAQFWVLSPQSQAEVHMYSNINIVYLPANTTSQLHPLNIGTIQSLKVHNRKLLLCFVISKFDETNESAWEVVKFVDMYQAPWWVAESWDAVRKEIIIKCFRRTGIFGSDLTVVGCSWEDHDPFDDVDTEQELDHLVNQVCPLAECCPVN